ncbi:MAG: PAS domain S-box protein [Thermoguttaceae bacterium]|nr:PAS domain S-box protein [Thermoguttaceae bacterium]MDW8038794.1 PAS domain S-box protein [Thermoguttaceae bacterium]
MEELLQVFQRWGEEVQAAYQRRLASAGPQGVRISLEEFSAFLKALERLGMRDPHPLNSWVSQWVQAALSAGASVFELLSALGSVESACQSVILKESDRKKRLALLLSQLADLMSQVRQSLLSESFKHLQATGGIPADEQKGAGDESLESVRTPGVESGGLERGRAAGGEWGAEERTSSALAALVEEEEMAVCLADQHGRPFYFNRAARRLFGLEEKQGASAVRLAQLYSEASWAELRDVGVPAVNQSGRWKGRCQLRHLGTGQLREYETVLRLVKTAGPERMSCLAILHRPIAEVDRLQEALAEVEARKHAILETSLDPIITINAAGQITEFNRAAEQVFGYSRHQVLGRTPSELLFPPSDSASQQDRIERYLRSGEGSQLGRRMEITARRASGELFPAEMTMTLSQEHGEPVLTFFLRDISQRKRAEEEQARYAAELERSNKELEQFAYIASHDLQEPLRKIRTFGERLQMKCGEQLDEVGKECLARMQDAAQRMQRLIDGLLTLSRVTTQAQEFVPVNLEEVVREVVRDLEAQIEKVQGRVEIGHLPTIQADPLQMRQLFQNLIGNALKFHRPDVPPLVRVWGRYLRDRTQRATGQPETEEFCRIVVEDNGIGFEEKYADRIFQMFQRLHPRDVYEGTGVGLAICRKIVQRHGGTITAQSTPGKGSTFICLLPVFQRSKKDKEKEIP